MHFRRLILIFLLAPLICGGASQLSFNPKDPVSVAAELKRINERYKSDLPRLSQELDQFALTVARANGQEAIIEQRMKLLKKYGIPISCTERPPLHGKSGWIIDHGAWVAKFEQSNHAIVASFVLDQTRYHDVRVDKVILQLRKKGTTNEEEEALAQGIDDEKTFRIDLPVERQLDNTFVTKFVLPLKEKQAFVLQISAVIEPALPGLTGWATNSIIPIR